MKTTRFYKFIIALLVVMNISTLLFLWLRSPEQHRPPKPGMLSKRLELTGDSQAKVDILEKEHHQEKRKLIRLDISLREELYDNIGKEGDQQLLLDQIDSNAREIEQMTFAFFDSVATYCNDTQRKQLRNMVHNAFNHIHRHPPKKKK